MGSFFIDLTLHFHLKDACLRLLKGLFEVGRDTNTEMVQHKIINELSKIVLFHFMIISNNFLKVNYKFMEFKLRNVHCLLPFSPIPLFSEIPSLNW